MPGSGEIWGLFVNRWQGNRRAAEGVKLLCRTAGSQRKFHLASGAKGLPKLLQAALENCADAGLATPWL
jgi:hypothetical protein